MIKRGKKTARNVRINRELKSDARKQGMPKMCALAYKEFEVKGKRICKGSFGLTWTHSLRRDRWTKPEHETECVLACVPCHTHAQNLGNDENEQIILEAMERQSTAFYDAP